MAELLLLLYIIVPFLIYATILDVAFPESGLMPVLPGTLMGYLGKIKPMIHPVRTGPCCKLWITLNFALF